MRFFAALLTAMVVLLTSRNSQAIERAVLELVVNGVSKGEAFVYLQGDDVLVPRRTLYEAGLSRVRAMTQNRSGVDYVSLKSTSPPITFTVDERLLTLEVSAPPSALARVDLDLSPAPPEHMLYDHDPSVFLNYAPRLIDGRHFQAFSEAGVSLGTMRLETGVNYRHGVSLTRLNTRAVFDDREQLRTATLGDTFVSAGPLGGAVMLGGLSVARNYSLDPYLIQIPRLGFAGSTMSPSTVDVYINDVLVRRMPVDPGEFQLSNLTPLTGAGMTRYVLRDAYGAEQRFETSYYASARVLAAGLSEYAYAVGLVREDFGTQSWGYGEPALIGRHRFGLSDHLTPGYHLQFDRTRVNGGLDLLAAGEMGELEVGVAGSVTRAGSSGKGMAGLLGYAYRKRGTSLRTFLRVTGRDFATLTLDPAQQRNLVEHATTTSHILSSYASLTTEVTFALRSDDVATARLGLLVNGRLNNELFLTLRTARSHHQTGAWEHDVFATLTWMLPGQHSVQLNEHTGARGTNVTGRLSRPLQQPTGVGYQVSGAIGNEQRVAAQVEGQASFGRAAASYTNIDGAQHSIVEGSGTIILVDGGVHFSRPSSQSFAVLDVRDAPGVRGYLNNQEMGTTDANGQLFIPGLLPYQANRLRINQADLPLDYHLEAEEIFLAPPPRGGAVVKFSARRIRIVRGRVVHTTSDSSIGIKYGTMRVRTPDGVFSSPLGSEGEFEFERLSEGSWPGLVTWEQGRCRVRIEVGHTESMIQQVGSVECVKIGAGAAAQ